MLLFVVFCWCSLRPLSKLQIYFFVAILFLVAAAWFQCNLTNSIFFWSVRCERLLLHCEIWVFTWTTIANGGNTGFGCMVTIVVSCVAMNTIFVFQSEICLLNISPKRRPAVTIIINRETGEWREKQFYPCTWQSTYSHRWIFYSATQPWHNQPHNDTCTPTRERERAHSNKMKNRLLNPKNGKLDYAKRCIKM